MTDVFTLWNLYELASGSYEIDVTMAATFRIDHGSDEWVRGMLGRCGVHLAELTYRITRSRCFYYSSYPEDKEWQDRWPLCWTIRATGTLIKTTHQNRLTMAPEGFDETDKTVTGKYDEEPHVGTALLLSDHRTDVPTLARQVDSMGQAARDRLPSAIPEVSVRSFGGDLHQIRLLLKGVNVRTDVGHLDALAEEARRGGGGAHWQDRHRQPGAGALAEEMSAWRDTVRGTNIGSPKKD